VVHPREEKMQQGGMWTVVLNGAAKKEDRQRDIRRMFKMLREVWLNIGVEKVDTHEGIMVKALLDSGTTEMFMDKKIAAKHRFRLQKLERPVAVRNVNGTNNSGGAITYQVEVNVYYKSHIERIRMDVCDLGKTDVILDAMVTSPQPRNQLGNRGGQDDKMSSIMWKEHKIGKETESKERKKGSHTRRRKDGEMGNGG